MEYQNIKTEVTGAVGKITIDRPKALNALNSETLSELSMAFSDFENGGEVRVCIVTGGGEKAFVAGADIGELKTYDMAGAKEFAENGHELFAMIENSPIVTIAAVNGFALGGGCELAMACDIRIASEKAKFGQPEVGLGIIPGFGGTQRLPRLVGKGRAKELIFTGRIIEAEEAMRIGLADAICPPDKIGEAAEALAGSIAGKGPQAIQFAKSAINTGLDLDLANGNRYEINTFAALFATADKEEGLSAFLEKRKPAFKGE
ncbi:MAG: enoyl-CoA hydratase-related protein [bacterium]